MKVFTIATIVHAATNPILPIVSSSPLALTLSFAFTFTHVDLFKVLWILNPPIPILSYLLFGGSTNIYENAQKAFLHTYLGLCLGA